eukprot:777580-Amphidinium_carterae.2
MLRSNLRTVVLRRASQLPRRTVSKQRRFKLVASLSKLLYHWMCAPWLLLAMTIRVQLVGDYLGLVIMSQRAEVKVATLARVWLWLLRLKF